MGPRREISLIPRNSELFSAVTLFTFHFHPYLAISVESHPKPALAAVFCYGDFIVISELLAAELFDLYVNEYTISEFRKASLPVR